MYYLDCNAHIYIGSVKASVISNICVYINERYLTAITSANNSINDIIMINNDSS